MRSKIFLSHILILFVLISSQTYAAEKKNIVTVNPVKFFIFFNINYYHKFNDNIVIGAGAQIPTFKSAEGYGISAEYRYYFSSDGLIGFYAAPNVSYNKIKIKGIQGEPFSLGVLLGYQWIFKNNLAVGVGLGADYYFLNSTILETDFSLVNGMLPAFRVDIGYAF